MSEIKNAAAEQQQPTGGNMRRVLSDGSESLAELREFMQGLRGKSPQEVLGDVANSSLVQSTLTAAVGFCVVILGLSVASYYWNQAFADAPPASVAKDNPAAEEPTESTPTQPEPTEPETAASPPSAPDAGVSGDPLLDKLGTGETKSADPKSNPLESSLDDLLDGAQ